MWYVIFSKTGTVCTDDFSKVEALMNSPWAELMEYEYEVRSEEPIYIDKMI